MKFLDSRYTRENLHLLIISAIFIIVHFLSNAGGGYGIFRDEYYYLACSYRPDFGYVDQPPLSILILALNRILFGDSLFAIRLLPTFAGAATVFLCGVICRETGGGRTAQSLAAVCIALAPVYNVLSGFYSMNAFDIFFWAVCFYYLVKIFKGGDKKLWLRFGVAAGLALQNKYSLLFMLAGLIPGMLITKHRKHFMSKWFWAGAGIAILIFLPNIIWLAANDWATVEFMQNATLYKNQPVQSVVFLIGQAIIHLHLAFPVWLAGLLWIVFYRNGRKYLPLFISFIVMLTIFLLRNGKIYYMSPFYIFLFAAGASAIESFFFKRNLLILNRVYIVIIVISGLLLLPMSVPTLNLQDYIKYSAVLEKTGLFEGFIYKDGRMPQFYGDRFGWQNMVSKVSRVYRKLTPEEREKCYIITGNYGEAGALEYYSEKLSLPPVISGHNNYWLWGYGDFTGDVAIVIMHESRRGMLDEVFEDCRIIARNDCRYAESEERGVPVFLCKNLKPEYRKYLDTLWKQIKSFI